MKKVKIKKSLPALLIVSYLLITCQAVIAFAHEKHSNSYFLSQQNPTVNSAEITEITQAYNEFDNSLKILLNQLQDVIDNKLNSKSLDFKTPNAQLKKLRQVNNNLLEIEKSNLSDTFSNINNTITEISKVIEPLSQGLTSKNVTQIQNYLDLPDKDPQVKRNLGSFGEITQKNIQEFLINRHQKLAEYMQLLTNNSPSESANLLDENKQLKAEINNFTWKYNLSVIAAFVAGICVGFFRKLPRQKIRNQRTHLKPNTPPYIEEADPDYSPNPDDQNYPSQTAIASPSPQPPTETNPPPRENPANSQAENTNRSISRIIHNASVNELITIYNQNRNSLSKYSTEVSETEESINQRRLGSHQAAILEKVSKGKGSYWIINKEGLDYLVPKGSIKINEFNYKTVESLFDCQGYQPNISSDFVLLKPAQVTSISQQMWQIVDYGVLRF
ncbi:MULTISPECIES: hypothetical protein [Calothrix]|uniref:Uncharacterized protein n=2 Tax=Calothrix TaxID=1186 RepID=A0ABR8AJM2_9CYAN|nr:MULTISPECIES: hypothetical protein [Calothrix]MBD2199435.1 hypothetical protein [Calothrix parietina FACHB-288]MBD2228236.1 hypothetical protein [Calothrix anomala FACHB-343]